MEPMALIVRRPAAQTAINAHPINPIGRPDRPTRSHPAGIDSTDQEMIDFLFTLGCFAGETITLISILADNYIIHVKGARYSIDTDLAKAILI